MSAPFPEYRPRRMRRTEALRRLVRETDLLPRHLIAPLFVKGGITEPVAISSMPGQYQHTVDSLRREAGELATLGVGGIILFGVPETKDDLAADACDPEGIAQQGVRAIRQEVGDTCAVLADLCMDEYTTHGHCGVLNERREVDNDATLEIYRKIALAQAEAGVDMVAPSGMMDGQVGALREALDEAGRDDVGIMAYAAKYASSFYGPFREAAEGAPQFGDRKGYQMDPPNADEALREIFLDIDEGADIVMVKPALAYLDIIRAAKEATGHPMAAYQVSGEYAMVKAAAERGWIDGEKIALEILMAIRRAGADLILTYHAKEAAARL